MAIQQSRKKMLKIGTLVQWLEEEEGAPNPVLGIIVGASKTLEEILDDPDDADAYLHGEPISLFYPVKWEDMRSICDEPEHRFKVLSVAE